MDKRAIGKARVKSLDLVLNDLLGQTDEALRETLQSDLFKEDGTFQPGKLAELVGLGCEAVTFRQNKALKAMVANAHVAILDRNIVNESIDSPSSPTKVAIGEKNQTMFLEWISKIGTMELPAPISHTGRLYRKALWSTYSGQSLLDITSVPTWFNSRPAVKKALDQLDLKVVQKIVVTTNMDSESIADDMEDSMTSSLVRKLRTEIKALREQLAAERHAREQAELAVKQNEWQVSLVTTGKIPHKQ